MHRNSQHRYTDIGKGLGPLWVSLLIVGAGGRVPGFNYSIGGWFICSFLLMMMAFTVVGDLRKQEIATAAAMERRRNAHQRGHAIVGSLTNDIEANKTGLLPQSLEANGKSNKVEDIRSDDDSVPMEKFSDDYDRKSSSKEGVALVAKHQSNDSDRRPSSAEKADVVFDNQESGKEQTAAVASERDSSITTDQERGSEVVDDHNRSSASAQGLQRVGPAESAPLQVDSNVIDLVTNLERLGSE